MSGALVGEIIDALEHGLELTSSEYGALIAIAEKCHQNTRQGSVRMARIASAIRVKGKAASRKTAERTVSRLIKRSIILRVRRGGRSGDGTAHASVYELLPQSQWVAKVSHREPSRGHFEAPQGDICTASTGHLGVPHDGVDDGTTCDEVPPNFVGASQPQAPVSANVDESGVGSRLDLAEARKIAGRLIRELWPPDLDSETLGIALGIAVKYLMSGEDDPAESRAILREALANGSFGINVPSKLGDDIAFARDMRRAW